MRSDVVSSVSLCPPEPTATKQAPNIPFVEIGLFVDQPGKPWRSLLGVPRGCDEAYVLVHVFFIDIQYRRVQKHIVSFSMVVRKQDKPLTPIMTREIRRPYRINVYRVKLMMAESELI